MTNFQIYLMKTLLNDPVEGIKLRRKYRKSFDSAFAKTFGKSFGFEIEIPISYFKNKKDINYYLDDSKLMLVYSELRDHFSKWQNKTEIKRRQVSHYLTVKTEGGNCIEIAGPISAKTLWLIQKLLNKVEERLDIIPGGKHEGGSSLHIHTSRINEKNMHSDMLGNSAQYVKKVIKRLIQLKIVNDLYQKDMFGARHRPYYNSTEFKIFEGSILLKDILYAGLVSRHVAQKKLKRNHRSLLLKLWDNAKKCPLSEAL